MAPRFAADARARLPPRSRSGRRTRELLAAGRSGDQRPARGPCDPARRLRQVRSADATERGGVFVVRISRGHALFSARRADRTIDHVPQRRRRSAAHTRSRGRQRRMESALRTPHAREARVPAPPRFSRIHSRPRSGAGGGAAVGERRVGLSRARSDCPLSQERAARHHGVVRVGARRGRSQ